ncbi:DeoR family transcriptional regulator [Longimycelium tulufanense]|uniref:Lactose phosphotransferase system repressor n=1 Tax=Longimycelium tulufanense TaxID=907463 RepID=A0A8J3FSL6_9PSEU|nr:DeoR/GlpR family DNA-binding transcription regulator [Longimycelium tulufanense]GGM39906.1 DeoR family transcriptional regulator [Longimycelium tulufanense]
MTVASSIDAQDRRRRLLQRLAADGHLRVEELAEACSVSTMTIRRDLQALEEQGKLRRVRGGAIIAGPQEFGLRAQRAAPAKRRIAEKLLTMVPQSAAIGLDCSSTIYRMACELRHARDLTVLTSAIETFQALQDTPGVRAYLTGGERDERTGSLVGPLARRTIESFQFHRCFLSATFLDPRLGASEATLEEAEVKHAIAAASEHVVLAVDAGKLGQRGAPARGVSLADVDVLVTDLDPTDSRLAPYRDHVELL